MKNRKKTKQQLAEDRNALYHKVILRNQELAGKNTELSQYICTLENALTDAHWEIMQLTRKKWWQFWKWFN